MSGSKCLGAMLVILFCAVVCGGPAFAQGSDASGRATARILFVEANEAAESGDWAAAADGFRRAYALVPDTGILFNLAAAQEQAGRLVESSESYRRFLRETAAEGQSELSTQAELGLERVLPRLSNLRLEVQGLEPSDRIALDGTEFPHEMLGVRVPVNPGLRVVEVRCPEEVCGRVERSLAESEDVALRLQLERPQDDVTEPLVSANGPAWAEPAPSRRVSPWVWGGVTAAVLAAAGTVTAILLLRSDDVQPGSFEDAWRVD